MAEKNEFQPERDRTYDALLKSYKQAGIELTMSDAVRLRAILRECREQQKENLDFGDFGENGFEITSEVETRFFRKVFGIDIVSYMANSTGLDDRKKRMKDLSLLIKSKIRDESEQLEKY